MKMNININNRVLGGLLVLLLATAAIAANTVYATSLTLKGTTGNVIIQADGDTDDYIEFDTPSNIPTIQATGANALTLTADNADAALITSKFTADSGGDAGIRIIPDNDATREANLKVLDTADGIAGLIFIADATERQFIPGANDTYDIGTALYRWQNGYFTNAIDVGDIGFNNGMRLIEAEKLTNNKIQGLVWLDQTGDAIMFLNSNGNLKIKGTIEENWGGIPYNFYVDDHGGVFFNDKVVKYPTLDGMLHPDYIDNKAEVADGIYFNAPTKPPAYVEPPEN